jgi:hypothetical protein
MSGGARCAVLSLLVLVGLVAFLGIRPHQPWLLWLTTAIAALATDGAVRSHRLWSDRQAFASAIYAGLPAIAVLGAGLFIHEAFDGYARTFVAILPAAAVGLVAYAEYRTVDFDSARYGSLRLFLAIATYVAAFALFTILSRQEVGLLVSAAGVAAVSAVLSLDLLRENRLFGEGALLLAAAIGLSVGELRLALYFFPLDSLLAGALLIIGFYFAAGLVHHLLDHDLEWSTAAEYVLVAAGGTAAVVVTRVAV